VNTTAFTPLSALLGGALIGLSAAGIWLLLGRIAGVSGIVGGLLRGGAGDRGWRLAFVAGMIGVGLIAGQLAPARLGASPASLPLLLAAGLVVGVGTAIGNGCTSGHGVCGIGRLSPRSLAATGVFMATAALTIVVLRLAGIR
jgi:hypothetical protein